MSAALKIALCILHYGNPSLTRRLHSQLLQNEPGCAPHVYVLDNAAPKPYQGAWLRQEVNGYWPGALNYGLQAFEQLGYTHLWFFNNDAYFISPPPYLGRTAGRLARMEKLLGRVGIYAPAVSLNPYHPQMVQNPAAQCRLVSYVDGIAPLVNLNCINSLGGLDAGDNIYGYGVDIWLGLRANQAGWAVVVDHQVALKHNYHSTAKTVAGFLAKAKQAEHEYLTQRLGPDYPNIIKTQQEQWQEITSL